jgi:Tol biopolymer transport system component
MVESVETSRIALANGAFGCPSSWFPDSIHFLVSAADGRQERHNIWKMSVTGGMPQTLTENGFGATVSADGLQIAFLRDGPTLGGSGRELWLMQSNGERIRMLAEAARSSQGAEWGHWFGPAVWSGTGHQIAYTIYKQGPGAANVSLLTHNPQSGQTHVLLADTNLESSLFWTRDGRLLYVLRGAQDLSGKRRSFLMKQKSDWRRITLLRKTSF